MNRKSVKWSKSCCACCQRQRSVTELVDGSTSRQRRRCRGSMVRNRHDRQQITMNIRQSISSTEEEEAGGACQKNRRSQNIVVSVNIGTRTHSPVILPAAVPAPRLHVTTAFSRLAHGVLCFSVTLSSARSQTASIGPPPIMESFNPIAFKWINTPKG